MKEDEAERYKNWYLEKQPLYKTLAKKVKALLEEVLSAKKIVCLGVEARSKSVESFKAKILQEISFKPEEMQDLAGVRIVGYVSSDVEKIANIIRELFAVDEKRSSDKAAILGVDKVGYRSLHYVAKLPKSRTILPEYERFEGLQFEIQIRTVLQHAWAEIEHDRNYKFSGILPKEIQRRFSLLAGLLEIADNEFNNISDLIETYSEKVAEKTKSGELNIPIDSTSLRQYLIEKFGEVQAIKQLFGPKDNMSPVIIHELNEMEITNLEELDRIIPKNFKENLIRFKIETNFVGLIRDILLIHNADRYLAKAWNKEWVGLGENFGEDFDFFKEYGVNLEELNKKMEEEYFHFTI